MLRYIQILHTIYCTYFSEKVVNQQGHISVKLRKTARFFDFNIRSWRAKINCKLYKSAHVMSDFVPFSINSKHEARNPKQIRMTTIRNSKHGGTS
jgi:hypothetical protein